MRNIFVFLCGVLLGVGATYAFVKTTEKPASALHTGGISIEIGDMKVPVIVVEYSSVGCGVCGEFKKEVWPQVREKYIDTKKIAWVLKPYPLSRYDLKAAMLAHCSENPEALMGAYAGNQARWMMAEDSLEEIKKIAQEHGMETKTIEACLADEKLLDAMIENRLNASQKYDINATPAFVIGGTVVPGYIKFEDLEALLEGALRHVAAGEDLATFRMEKAPEQAGQAPETLEGPKKQAPSPQGKA